MSVPWQRILGGLAASGLVLLLAGCEISGTVEVRSHTEVIANLIVTKAEADCLGLTEFAGLVVKGTPDPDGNQLCRAQGTVDLAELKDYGVEVSQVGEYLRVDLALPRQIQDMPMSIDITFPGPVIDAGATTAAGNQVTLTEGVGVPNPSRTRVVALSHPGPQWWVLGLAAGFAVGVALTVALLLLLRRRRLGSRVAEDGSPPPEDGSQPPVRLSRSQDRGPRSQDLDYEARFAPPSTGQAPREAPDPAPPVPATGPEPATDHGIWAPPADPGDR